MKLYAATSKGVHKTSSEDRILIGDRILKDTVYSLDAEEPIILGICDGVGGQAGGDLAADFLCRNAQRYLTSDPEAGVKQLATALLEYAKTFQKERHMASTMTMLVPSQKVIVHVGNTRVYRVVRNCLRQVTTDHTTRQLLLQQNRIEAAAAVSPSELSGCMGGGSEAFSAFAEILPLPDGDLVLTSDGIHDTLNTDTLEELLLSGDDIQYAIQKTVQAAAQNGSLDDRSILVVKKSSPRMRP